MQIKESLPIGTILDSGFRKYEIKSVLGKGGFGITYLASSTIYVDNIPVEAQFAIKEHYISSMNERQGTSVSISNENNTDEIKESIESFLVEAQRLNKLSLNHNGLVRVNENFRANGTAYYVMEYIKGLSLRDYVKRSSQGRLSEADALRLFRPIANTIDYLHDNKVTHLDIKPDNILIRESGEPVVIDFGLSKHYSSKGTPTSTIKAAGCSAGYSPMEQYAGITTFSPEVDIYALGATLLYMLTGKDPMISTDINEDIIRRSIPQDVSRQTSDAVIHAMEKLKENRTHNVSDLFYRIELLEQNNVDNSTENNKTRKLKKNKQTLNREKPSASLKQIFVEKKKVLFLILFVIISLTTSLLFIGKHIVNKQKGIDNLKVAKNYFGKKDTLSALPYLRKAVDYGNAEAMTELGICYFKGGGVKPDTIMALHYFEKAASQKDSKGQEKLGYCYYFGYGVPKDTIKAYKYYKLSADQGYNEGMYRLGNCYYDGNGVSQDYAEAAKWFRKAAVQGIADAQHNLGVCYYNGNGVSQDYAEAAKWFRKAAVQGIADAQHNLGVCYYNGNGVSQDYAEAAKWFRKAAEQGIADAQFCLGDCYYDGCGVSQNHTEAIKWYRKAANQGIADAQFSLGVCYADGCGVSQNHTEAIKWYRKAADQGSAEAQNNLGVYYYNGNGVSQDYAEAAKWFRKAAEQGYDLSLYSLGMCYYLGTGVAKDKVEAKSWMEKAAAQGYEKAKNFLKEHRF